MIDKRKHSFSWGNSEPLTISKDEAKYFVYKTIPTQRNASYSDAAEETFINSIKDSFIENIEAPTPQIRKICGIECPNKN